MILQFNNTPYCTCFILVKVDQIHLIIFSRKCNVIIQVTFYKKKKIIHWSDNLDSSSSTRSWKIEAASRIAMSIKHRVLWSLGTTGSYFVHSKQIEWACLKNHCYWEVILVSILSSISQLVMAVRHSRSSLRDTELKVEARILEF